MVELLVAAIMAIRLKMPVPQRMYLFVPQQHLPDNLRLPTTYNLDPTSGIKAAPFEVIPRIQWGANPKVWDIVNPTLHINDIKRLKQVDSCRYTPVYTPKSKIIFHHTVTYTNGIQGMREIYTLHAYKRVFKVRKEVAPGDYILEELPNNRGWGDIGYNFIIDRNGHIYEGKIGGPSAFGYHSYTTANYQGIGIALIGNTNIQYPTKAQQDALARLTGYLSALYNIPLTYKEGPTIQSFIDFTQGVWIHKQLYRWNWESNTLEHVPSTACPGNHLTSLTPSIVTKAQEYKQQFQTVINYREYISNTLSSLKNKQNFTLIINMSNPEYITKLLQKAPTFYGFSNIKQLDPFTLQISIAPICNRCTCTLPDPDFTGYDKCSSYNDQQICAYFAHEDNPVYWYTVQTILTFSLIPSTNWIAVVE